MPLKKGHSKATVSQNIKELVQHFDETGTIGASKPASKRQAVKQAVAISLKQAGRSRSQRPGTKR
ncbi:MAG TPA: hypothetical protein VL381_00665 [Rhodocyclaceae bacterium]|nr:hypothetical protein [Rhodocyclaceae bacterium]